MSPADADRTLGTLNGDGAANKTHEICDLAFSRRLAHPFTRCE
jgi:hypothetical protein